MEEAVVNSPNNATENGESNVGTITVNGTESRDSSVDSVNVQENSNTKENLNVVSLDALEEGFENLGFTIEQGVPNVSLRLVDICREHNIMENTVCPIWIWLTLFAYYGEAK